MKIFSLFFAVLLLMLQGTLGFMRAPGNDVQCKQAGGTCSTDHCPLPNTRSFGHCQQGVPCCRTVVSYGFDEDQAFLGGMGSHIQAAF
ncbi:gallinacin-8-like [Phalacrocorax carbo]|uniref:gallinacin-8-like n=1 Tax=Phalacrocorax carbo TaxID=9209 RepID=UPI003119F0F8